MKNKAMKHENGIPFQIVEVIPYSDYADTVERWTENYSSLDEALKELKKQYRIYNYSGRTIWVY